MLFRSKAEQWLMQGIDEFASRESVLALANHYYQTKQWDECLLVAKRALDYKERTMSFLSENWAWGPMVHDLIALSSYETGEYAQAYEHGKMAVEMSPNDTRLLNNLKYYRSKVDANVQSDDLRGQK